ncbi:MAG: class I SAM-dependent methyltransferase [Desulfuromonadales bacterium]
MMARLDGYVANMEYVHTYCREMSPSALNLALNMQCIEPLPLNSGFAFCDLGCGQGMSVNIFASCHPESQFHAVDFSSAHIKRARELAEQAGLVNVTFWEASFECLDKFQMPDFDIITLHGVYSWVNADNRKNIIKFIRCKLKVGGVVYVSYNCLPGWSSIAPVRQLLVSGIDMKSDISGAQIATAIDFAVHLRSMNLSYFNSNPSSARFLDELSKRPKNYLAHEYFNEYWVQFYHSEVVEDFVSAGLCYAGSASPADNLDFLRFSPEEQQLINSIDDPVVKETIKDFTVNQNFRKDVFTIGKNKLRMGNLHYTARCRFALVEPISGNTIRLNFPHCNTFPSPALFIAVLHALAERNLSLNDVLDIPDIAKFDIQEVYQSLMTLLAAGCILPAVVPSQRTIASTRLFNYALLERTILNMEPLPLASPVVQGGIPLNWVQRQLVLCLFADIDDPFSFVSSMMRKYGRALTKDGGAIKSWEENLEELDRQINWFHAHQLPLLKRLEVV